VPEEDMPFLPDGRPVDIVLNPLGVPSRMNVGQILETHLGWCATLLGFQAKTPVFRGATEAEIGVLLRLSGLRWAGDGLALRHRAPEVDGATIDALLGDLRQSTARVLTEATLADLGRDKVTASTRKLFEQVREFVRAAGVELGERAVEVRRQEVAHHQAMVEEAEGERKKSLQKALKDLDAAAGNDAAAALEKLGFTALAGLVRGGSAADGVARAVDELIRAAGLTPAGKVRLRDGRSGVEFNNDVTVGMIYMLKLSHLVDDKIHARSIGPYSLVTQQPLAGKAQFGGQRFGEMEVWALEAYGAAHLLQEMLTVKSDDVNGRSKVYEAIVKGQNLPEPGIPESFNVLVKELQALGLKVHLGETAEGEE
jgi:DNA-directed RNA polymerase subunit beta